MVNVNLLNQLFSARLLECGPGLCLDPSGLIILGYFQYSPPPITLGFLYIQHSCRKRVKIQMYSKSTRITLINFLVKYNFQRFKQNISYHPLQLRSDFLDYLSPTVTQKCQLGQVVIQKVLAVTFVSCLINDIFISYY